MSENVWENDDFIFKGAELKGMTQKGKDKVKTQGLTDLTIPVKSKAFDVLQRARQFNRS